MTERDPLRTAQKLVENLRIFYDKYEKSATKLVDEEMRSGGWIGRWFRGSSRLDDSELHSQFYAAVEKRCTLLADYLPQLSEEQSQTLASQAVSVILNPVPDNLRDNGGWMRFAAEPLCAPLLRYLPKDELGALRAKYLDLYPKRKMFPPQKQLLAQMDALLSESGRNQG